MNADPPVNQRIAVLSLQKNENLLKIVWLELVLQTGTNNFKFSFDGSPDDSITEIERNARTVLVTQLASRLRSRELADFFTTAGRVRDVRIVMDKNTGRSKGQVGI